MVHDKVKEMYVITYRGKEKIALLGIYNSLEEAVTEANRLDKTLYQYIDEFMLLNKNKSIHSYQTLIRKCLVSIDN